MDLEFLDRSPDPVDEIVGAWSRRHVISMDTRFCEAMARALAAEPEAEATVTLRGSSAVPE
jgi:hypothetical protein